MRPQRMKDNRNYDSYRNVKFELVSSFTVQFEACGIPSLVSSDIRLFAKVFVVMRKFRVTGRHERAGALSSECWRCGIRKFRHI